MIKLNFSSIIVSLLSKRFCYARYKAVLIMRRLMRRIHEIFFWVVNSFVFPLISGGDTLPKSAIISLEKNILTPILMFTYEWYYRIVRIYTYNKLIYKRLSLTDCSYETNITPAIVFCNTETRNLMRICCFVQRNIWTHILEFNHNLTKSEIFLRTVFENTNEQIQYVLFLLAKWKLSFN